MRVSSAASSRAVAACLSAVRAVAGVVRRAVRTPGGVPGAAPVRGPTPGAPGVGGAPGVRGSALGCAVPAWRRPPGRELWPGRAGAPGCCGAARLSADLAGSACPAVVACRVAAAGPGDWARPVDPDDCSACPVAAGRDALLPGLLRSRRMLRCCGLARRKARCWVTICRPTVCVACSWRTKPWSRVACCGEIASGTAAKRAPPGPPRIAKPLAPVRQRAEPRPCRSLTSICPTCPSASG